MTQLICGNCHKVYDSSKHGRCPKCKRTTTQFYEFSNSDDFLQAQIPKIERFRKDTGLQGLVKGLNCVIINTEPENQRLAVKEILKNTGFSYGHSFQDTNNIITVLNANNSADILVKSRKIDKNPFRSYNIRPKTQNLPNTRLESFVFEVLNLSKYVEIQKDQDVKFLTDIIDRDNYSFIQTKPSKFIGTSYGFIQWHKNKGDYHPDEFKSTSSDIKKPDFEYLKNIKELDHTATRVKAQDRDSAIIEFMKLTNYNFDFAIYVNHLNSITNVARLSAKDFAMVFTSGITNYKNPEESGPTERFTYNYGPRVHHMAFNTDKIEDSFEGLKANGMDFLIQLVGSENEGLKQTFSVQSPNTLIVNEYIHRYGDFDGFFTRSNVTDLTRSTDKQ